MATGKPRGKSNFVVDGDHVAKFPEPKWVKIPSKNTQDILVVLVVGLIGLLAINFFFDYSFRDTVNDFHESVLNILEIQNSINVEVIEKMRIIFDELFDRVWEDLEQT